MLLHAGFLAIPLFVASQDNGLVTDEIVYPVDTFLGECRLDVQLCQATKVWNSHFDVLARLTSREYIHESTSNDNSHHSPHTLNCTMMDTNECRSSIWFKGKSSKNTIAHF